MSQNNQSIIYAGVDVAKDSLALAFQGAALALSNDAAGHARLLRHLRKATHPVQVILEASGGYEQGVVRVLHGAGIALSVVEPSRVRAFARAKGLRAKSDPIDAQVLCAFGQALHPRVTPAPSAQEERLGEVLGRRRQLLDFLVAESNRAAHYRDPLLRRQSGALLRTLRGQIAQCEKAVQELLAAAEPLGQRAARLQEVPGVGALTAATLLAEMPELGSLPDESAAALAGLAPYIRQSGPWAGTRHIAGGRKVVRCALYMAALSAAPFDPIFKHFYQRLLAAGKKKKVALTAVMRKLIVLLNRLLKHPTFQLRSKLSAP